MHVTIYTIGLAQGVVVGVLGMSLATQEHGPLLGLTFAFSLLLTAVLVAAAVCCPEDR